jgi:hypothetical protein
MDTNIWANIGDHLVVSLVSWLAVSIVGGGLGYLAAKLLSSWIKRSPDVLPLIALFPWRSIAAWISVYAITSPYVRVRFGIGNASGVYSMTIVFFAWAIFAFAQTSLHHWFDAPLQARILSTIRTLAILSIALTATTVHGMGFLIVYKGFQGPDFELATQGFEITAILLIVVDVFLGGIQYLVGRYKRGSILERLP